MSLSRVMFRSALLAGALGFVLSDPAPAQLQSPIPLSIADQSDLPSSASRTNVGTSTQVDLAGQSIGRGVKGRPKIKVRKKVDPVQGDATVSRWQFGDVVLEDPNDPDSDVAGATLFMPVDSMTAGTTDLDHEIDNAAQGDSGEADIATEFSDRIEIDTGTATFVLAKDGSVLQEIWSGSNQVFTTGTQNGLYVVDSSGTVFSSAWGPCTVTLEENGPAYSRISIVGLMEDQQGNVLTDYELRLMAWYGSETLTATFEVTPGYWTNADDLQISQIHFLAQVAGGANPVLDAGTALRAVLGTTHSGEGVVEGPVTTESPDPYQVVSLNGLQNPRGATSMTRSPVNQWGMMLDPAGFALVNVGFTNHFVAANANNREVAEFALGVQDPVTGDLDTHGRNLIYDVAVTLVE